MFLFFILKIKKQQACIMTLRQQIHRYWNTVIHRDNDTYTLTNLRNKAYKVTKYFLKINYSS